MEEYIKPIVDTFDDGRDIGMFSDVVFPAIAVIIMSQRDLFIVTPTACRKDGFK